ncbi:TPR-like protein [Viridothelium virens]|uniref:TPR-like protein n=1 Tax=Viridothelium virens TaxID=1048519 RepID=A0A6A6H8D5_VIRVR|nr:TPR-like protein [Viridothelium virens]
MSKESAKKNRTGSPLWDRAVERYRAELAGNDDYLDVSEVGSLEDLLNGMKLAGPGSATLSSLNRLGPRMKFVDDFSAIIALYFGADARITALVWGSIRMLLTLASSSGDTLVQDVLDMLEELSLTLPRFRAYEETLPMDRALENALLEVYTEVICFYARAIHFFRTHPHTLLRRGAWEEFRTDFGRTVRRIKRLSSAVEAEADIARMRTEKAKYKEVLDLMDDLRVQKTGGGAVTRCHYIPFELNPRFCGRKQALEAIGEALDPGKAPESLKSFALYGMGGVGKTQIALQYARQCRHKYQFILWISADTFINIGQSFRDIARRLKLGENEDELQDAASAILVVKEWLVENNSPWLVIFDNADNLETLKLAWPGGAHGSVLLTTRDFNAAHAPATSGLHVQPFDYILGSQLLLDIIGLDVNVESNRLKAEEIARTLGGLPLALNQIGGFITQRKMPLQDFLPLYERNAPRIDSRKTGLSDYDHTLSTVWEMSLTRLSGDSVELLQLMAFLEPDSIHEEILVEGSKNSGESQFQFMQDEMDLGDAQETLLQAALIDRSNDDAILSLHRLIQATVIRRLTKDSQSQYFSAAVSFLSWGFPDTWSVDVGHQFQAWTKCEKCLPHVHHLVKLAGHYQIPVQDAQAYGELLLRCSWYLYEREVYDVARDLISVALDTFLYKGTLAFASAVDLSGLVDLDLNDAQSALDRFHAAYKIRVKCSGPDDPLVAASLNNIALAYTEMEELDKAYEAHMKAIEIRLCSAPDRIGNSYSNLSSLQLRMGKPNEAEKTLKKCPSLLDFTDETFLNTGNPRFSGDMVLFSRIRLRQGRNEDAMRLASKALTFRQKMLGNRLKTCDSLYDVAGILHKQHKLASAIELLTQLVTISEILREGEGQLARANYKLAVLYAEKGMEVESRDCRARAVEIRNKLIPSSREAPFEEKEFNRLCLWMLW